VVKSQVVGPAVGRGIRCSLTSQPASPRLGARQPANHGALEYGSSQPQTAQAGRARANALDDAEDDVER
jgi:hypothetical protein